MLANHPLDCPICDKGGECPLQDNTFKFGLGVSRFTEEKRQKDKAFVLSDRIVLDRERCIMCYRCTRFQAEIPGDEALAAVDRGGDSEIGVLEGETFDSPFSGNTIELCPVGALTSRQYRFKARPWDLQRTPSICAGCCRRLQHRAPRPRRPDPAPVGPRRPAPSTTAGSATMAASTRCRRSASERVAPAAGAPGRLAPAGHLGRGVRPRRRGAQVRPGRRAGLAGALERGDLAVRGRAAGEPAGRNVGFWPSAIACLAADAARSPILPACKTVVLVGLDPWTELPVLALWLRKAVVNGGTLVAIGPENGLYRDTAHWLRVAAGEEVGIVERLLAAREKADEAVPDRRDPRPHGQRGDAPTDALDRGRCCGRRDRAGRAAGRRAPGRRPGRPSGAGAAGRRRSDASPRAAWSAARPSRRTGAGRRSWPRDLVAADREPAAPPRRPQAGDLAAVLLLGARPGRRPARRAR